MSENIEQKFYYKHPILSIVIFTILSSLVLSGIAECTRKPSITQDTEHIKDKETYITNYIIENNSIVFPIIVDGKANIVGDGYITDMRIIVGEGKVIKEKGAFKARIATGEKVQLRVTSGASTYMTINKLKKSLPLLDLFKTE